MENRILRSIVLGIAGILVLLFILPALLRLLIVGAVFALAYKFIQKRRFYRKLKYRYYTEQTENEDGQYPYQKRQITDLLRMPVYFQKDLTEPSELKDSNPLVIKIG